MCFTFLSLEFLNVNGVEQESFCSLIVYILHQGSVYLLVLILIFVIEPSRLGVKSSRCELVRNSLGEAIVGSNS